MGEAMKRKDGGKGGTKLPTARSAKSLGEILLRKNVVTLEMLEVARTEVALNGGTLSKALVKLGHLSDQVLVDELARHYDLPAMRLTDDAAEIDPEVISIVPRHIVRLHKVIPVSLKDRKLTIATADPANYYAADDVKAVTGFNVEQVITSEEDIEWAIDTFYKEDTLDDILGRLDDSDIKVLRGKEELGDEDLIEESKDNRIVRLVNFFLVDALKKRASDIHIEAFEKVFRVRYRIDGVLQEIMNPPLEMRNAVVSRIKILSNMDIAERRLPQDGKIKLKLGSQRDVDYRVSVLPTTTGENVVIRILDKSSLQTEMTKLGFSEEQLDLYQSAIRAPHGMVLVTGPTGSGKTTTLYSGLLELNKLTDKILTVEDPVEIQVEGINQVQINDDIGLTFPAALRSFLRQDPDIIMVGEIRDYVTAEIAIKSALTGHLVLSTLHTNDATSTITRLINMGLEPYLVTSAINLVIAQRLVRKICTKCKESLDLRPEVLIDLGADPKSVNGSKVHHGLGCKHCSDTGYKGRIAVYECLAVDDRIREAIVRGLTASELRGLAIKLGMVTLRQSGIQKVLEGVTTIEEVVRVTQ
jgi:type IV pilus assembly protein PilB